MPDTLNHNDVLHAVVTLASTELKRPDTAMTMRDAVHAAASSLLDAGVISSTTAPEMVEGMAEYEQKLLDQMAFSHNYAQRAGRAYDD